MSAAPEPPAPPLVPGYLLSELLGRGGSGEVWRAEPRGGGAPVAVKVLLDGDPERQAREAALLGELDHPHLVRLHEVVHQPRRGSSARVALVLDLLDGGSLAALLARRGRLRPGEVVTAIAPVAAALAAAHDSGVVHGDLSPGNIVFTAEGRPVLTDLGMARVIGEERSGGVTPAYVDPTVARGGAVGPASDVFGVAAAAFHALTGIPPWNAATPADRLAVAAAGQLPDLVELAPEAPADLLAVIGRGLAADPHERGSAAAFALDLRHACRPEPVRLAAGGNADVRTGDPVTELTHVVPGRRPRTRAAGPTGSRPRRRPVTRWARRLLLRLAAVPHVGGGVALGVLVVGIAVWFATARGPATHEAPVAAAPSAAARSGTATASTAAVPAAGESGSASASQERTPASPAEWGTLVEELYRRRAAAFTAGSGGLLEQVYTADSAQLAADRQALQALGDAGEVLRGYGPSAVRVTEVSAPDAGGTRVQLRLIDGWSAYEVVRGGAAVTSAPARGELPVRMVLVRTDSGWRIALVERGA